MLLNLLEVRAGGMLTLLEAIKNVKQGVTIKIRETSIGYLDLISNHYLLLVKSRISPPPLEHLLIRTLLNYRQKN